MIINLGQIKMASRPIFITLKSSLGVKKINIDFTWSAGMSKVQKQKSIDSLHSEANKQGINNILEISSKSKLDLGIKLSAFNLSFETKKGIEVSVESAFQGSKVFEHGGPYSDLLYKSSREAKKDPRIRESGNLKYFQLLNKTFPINPRTYFYDWLYINTLNQPINKHLADEIMEYEAFTDIEFNPDKSINCQAYSAALYVSLKVSKKLDFVLASQENFLQLLKHSYNQKILIQQQLL